jgi:type I restriction enzyme S subunit
MSLKPYPEYKDNGQGIASRLPSHWTIRRIKNVALCLDYLRIPKNSSERAEIEGDIPYWGANSIQGYVNEALVHGPVVLVGEDGAPFFDDTKPVAFAVDGPLWPNNHVHVLRSKANVDHRFLTACLNSVDYSLYIKGSTRDKLNQSDLMAIEIPHPPLPEQLDIANYLDQETAEIDDFIRDQEELIDILNERRAAIVDTLVWGGAVTEAEQQPMPLDPLPAVPSHWTVVRNKNIWKESKRLSVDGSEEMLTVSHITGVTPRSEKNVTMFEAASTEGYRVVSSGNLVINTMWAWMGALGTSAYNGIVSPAYGVYESLDPRNNSRYFHHLYRSSQYVRLMTNFSRGLWSSRLRLYPESFLALPTVVPPYAEQTSISEKIDSETSKIEAAMSDAREAISLSKERRAAVISAAVTGKIDVRHHFKIEKARIQGEPVGVA